MLRIRSTKRWQVVYVVQKDTTVSERKASLTNTRGQGYAVLQRSVQTVPMETVGIHKRTLQPAQTVFGTDVFPRFLCRAAAEVGDVVEDPVEVFYKPWEDRMAALVAGKYSGVDLKKAERLLNSEVAKCAREMWMEVEKITIRRQVPRLAKSFALFWMQRFFESVDAILQSCK
jgi:hypothetical protein